MGDEFGGAKSVVPEPEGAAFEGEETLHFLAGDTMKFERKDGKVSIAINGDVKVEDYPMEIKLDTNTRSFTLGRQKMVLSPSYTPEEVKGFADIFPTLWPKGPTNVVHVHSMEEFDQIKAENGKVVAKFSADWCGPCH